MDFDLPEEIGVELLTFPDVGVELLAWGVVLGGVSPLGGVLRMIGVGLWRGLLCLV